MNDTEHHAGSGVRVPRTWRDRLEASLLIGALVAVAWTGVVMIAGWPVDTTENLEGLLNAALNNFINLSVLAFLIQTIWFWVRTRRRTG
jgi:cobalamin biosynthesis protein CobD/CbiB